MATRSSTAGPSTSPRSGLPTRHRGAGSSLAPLGSFPPERPVLMLYLADGRSARIAIARGTTSTGRLATVHFDIVGAWSQSTS